MLLAGDELRRTQRGNNNATRDNELSWVDWDLDERANGLLEFTRRLVRLVRSIRSSGAPRSSPRERQELGCPDVWWFHFGRR